MTYGELYAIKLTNKAVSKKNGTERIEERNAISTHGLRPAEAAVGKGDIRRGRLIFADDTSRAIAIRYYGLSHLSEALSGS